jgi:NitT/TauT family transport system substrate-binding protein
MTSGGKMQALHRKLDRAAGAFGVVFLALICHGASAQDDSATIAIGYQRGLAYLPVILMDQQHLFEKHAARLGIKTAAEYRLLGGPAPIVDGLLGGALQGGVVGTPSAILLTDKTKDIKLIGSMGNFPMLFMTKSPGLKTVADIGPQDKIATVAVKTGIYSLVLQMKAAKLWGPENFDRLDKYTVTMSHADALTAMLSGSGTITVHGCSYPHALQEQDAGAHVILDAKEVLGGTNGMITGLVASQRFCSANPKTCEALIAALTEAHQWINEDKDRAANFFFDYGKTGETLPALQKQIKSTEVKFTIKPEGLQPFADFMYGVSKLVKTKLGYNDLVFDNLK